MGKSKVTDEMLKAGLHAYNQCDVDTKALEAAYNAMRAARPRKGRAQKPVVDRDAVAEAIRQAYYTKATSILSVDWAVLADAAIAAMGAVALPEELPSSVARAGRYV